MHTFSLHNVHLVQIFWRPLRSMNFKNLLYQINVFWLCFPWTFWGALVFSGHSNYFLCNEILANQNECEIWSSCSSREKPGASRKLGDGQEAREVCLSGWSCLMLHLGAQSSWNPFSMQFQLVWAKVPFCCHRKDAAGCWRTPNEGERTCSACAHVELSVALCKMNESYNRHRIHSLLQK